MRCRDRHEGLSRRPDRDGVALNLGEGVGVVDEDLEFKILLYVHRNLVCVISFEI